MDGRVFMTRYSVCMTCFNEAATVREALNSLLGQLDEDYEVVIVDNFSSDGTYEVLQEYSKAYHVKVVQMHSSRGEGRQKALECASGEYVIANLDLDDVFLPTLQEIVEMYHQKAEGKVMVVFNSQPPPDVDTGWIQNMTIGPRELLNSVGGWRDLNLYEDWDIWNRANQVGKYAWAAYRFAANETTHPEPKRAFARLRRRYERYYCKLRLRMKIFSRGEKIGLSQRLAYISARLSVSFRGALSGQDPGFKSLSSNLYIDLNSTEGVREEQGDEHAQ
jgi:glycosyltransferase involved in cell wall biosynthesis